MAVNRDAPPAGKNGKRALTAPPPTPHGGGGRVLALRCDFYISGLRSTEPVFRVSGLRPDFSRPPPVLFASFLRPQIFFVLRCASIVLRYGGARPRCRGTGLSAAFDPSTPVRTCLYLPRTSGRTPCGATGCRMDQSLCGLPIFFLISPEIKREGNAFASRLSLRSQWRLPRATAIYVTTFSSYRRIRMLAGMFCASGVRVACFVLSHRSV